MSNTYPAQVETFEVVGQLVKGVADSADSDQAPDVIPIVGATVTFTPDLDVPIFKVPNATPPVTVFQESVVATTDENGFLKIDADANEGVFLPFGGSPDINPTNWTWGVRVSVGGDFPDLTFHIFGSSGGTVDLASYIPVDASGGENNDQLTISSGTSAPDDSTPGNMYIQTGVS